jgi:hypothetical protein
MICETSRIESSNRLRVKEPRLVTCPVIDNSATPLLSAVVFALVAGLLRLQTLGIVKLGRGARRRLGHIERLFRLRRPIASLRNRPADDPINRHELERLRRAWVNPGYEAELDYLELLCEYAAFARAPVLECGSGLTTVLLALTAGRRGLQIWSLEHDAGWYRATSLVLRRFRLDGIRLCYAPLVRHDQYVWYDAPLSLMPPRFGLVVCDGPPGSTPGGRSGLMPVIGERLKGATILVDDAERPSEQAMLASWSRWWAAESQRVTTQSGSQVAAVTIPGGPDDS